MACYPEHLNIVDELVSLLLMELLREKEGFLVGVVHAPIDLLLFHHSYRHLPCRMTENQGLVETTFGVRRVAVQVQLSATRLLNWILGQASKINHVMPVHIGGDKNRHITYFNS